MFKAVRLWYSWIGYTFCICDKRQNLEIIYNLLLLFFNIKFFFLFLWRITLIKNFLLLFFLSKHNGSLNYINYFQEQIGNLWAEVTRYKALLRTNWGIRFWLSFVPVKILDSKLRYATLDQCDFLLIKVLKIGSVLAKFITENNNYRK